MKLHQVWQHWFWPRRSYAKPTHRHAKQLFFIYLLIYLRYLFHLHQHTILLKSAIIKSKIALQKSNSICNIYRAKKKRYLQTNSHSHMHTIHSHHYSILEPCNLYANLKKLHHVAKWKGIPAHF